MCSGQFEIDEIVLRRDEGYSSERIAKFASVPEEQINEDFFVPPYVYEEVAQLKKLEANSGSKL